MCRAHFTANRGRMANPGVCRIRGMRLPDVGDDPAGRVDGAATPSVAAARQVGIGDMGVVLYRLAIRIIDGKFDW